MTSQVRKVLLQDRKNFAAETCKAVFKRDKQVSLYAWKILETKIGKNNFFLFNIFFVGLLAFFHTQL
jgi:hypothetical protein